MSEPDPGVLQEDFTLLTRPVPAGEAGADGAGLQAYYFPALAAAALLLAVAWAVLRWRSRVRGGPRGKRADRVALEELGRWSDLADEARFRSAVTQISATLRRYVEARFGVSAPTMTTEQFLRAQHLGRHIPARHMPFWDAFLEAGDAIKYAGGQPSPATFHTMLQAAQSFVRESSEGAA